MSDEEKTLSGQAAVSTAEGQAQVEGSPTAANETTEQSGQTTEPQFMTREEAQVWKEDIINQAKSYSDKGRVALKKQLDAVEATITTAETLGKPFSDADKNELRQKARVIAETNLTEGELAQTSPEQAQAAARELYAHDLKMQGKYDVELVPDDPETKTLKITGNLATDKTTIEAAFKAKRDRLASQNLTQTVEASKAGVRLGVVPGGKPSEIAKSSRDYWDKAHK